MQYFVLGSNLKELETKSYTNAKGKIEVKGQKFHLFQQFFEYEFFF